jgi:hypothetical protein
MKIMIVLLVLVAVLFVVVVVWGHGNNKKTGEWNTFKADSYPAIGNLGNLFGAPGPTLKATELSPSPAPLKRAHGTVAAGKFALSKGDQPTTFKISPDSKNQFRQATFTATNQDCVVIEYKSADGSGGALSDQRWPEDGKTPKRSTVDSKHPTQAKFQVLSVAGSVTFTFNASDCTVRLE